jgi:hypothetical protein
MPSLATEEFEELFKLYVRVNCESDIPPKEARKLQEDFARQLQDIWEADPGPFPFTSDNFRRLIVDRCLERLDPRRRRHRF